MANRHFLIVAGDPSADRHGAALVKALRQREPDLRVTALGGTHLRGVADSFLFPLVGLGGFGFWEPLLALPRLAKALKRVKDVLRTTRPDLVIPIDYFGFNIHVARAGKAAHVPVVYYISPQVWASRPGRIQKLKDVVSRILVLFPFEEALYRSAGVPVTFVGHPLLEQLPSPQPASQTFRIGLLPGSRWGTIARHLPVLTATAAKLRSQFPSADFVLVRPEEIDARRYHSFLATTPWIRLVADGDYRERSQMTLAISVSGTAALENMLLGIPMILMYKLSALTYQIAKRLIRVPYIGIPNLLAGASVVPELIQDQANPNSLAQVAADLLRNQGNREAMRQKLLSLRESLGSGGIQRAADAILSELPATQPSSVAAAGGGR